ncbi:NAD(P)/FAD-dependent oxidoreductase [Streptomyces sp. NPDC090119]|uniref:NAD(P)/FAD-dependent oxidoreductase n=1 Tax=Streptomyces sp. NPDC090119 TaxID=3365951 RepID=UPI0037F2817F
MNLSETFAELVGDFRANGRIVIVGASLAGLRAAEALREGGFTGPLTIIGDEPYEPYDRPPLSKQVLKGWVSADNTKLPRLRGSDATWRLGDAAVELDRANRLIHLAGGEQVPYDRLLIATGTRARQWPNPAEAALDGVHTLRSRDDAAQVRQALAARPSRVLVIGAGFIGSEAASVCRELDIPVTVAERASAPLVGALGGVIGKIAAEMQREHGVDLRCGVGVSALEGDTAGHVRRARLSDGTTVEADLVLASLGSIRNVEWLEGSGLAAGYWGVGCDAGGRAFDINGVATDSVYVAGDIARSPYVLYDYEFLAMEHWDNAVFGAEVAAHNMINLEPDYRPNLLLPGFWSGQFGRNIKSVGVPPFGDEIVFTQGSVRERRFVAAYGRRGRIVAAVAFDGGKWLEHYGRLIEQSAPFPPPRAGWDLPDFMQPMPAEFPTPGVPAGVPDVVLTGHDPTERRAEFQRPGR